MSYCFKWLLISFIIVLSSNGAYCQEDPIYQFGFKTGLNKFDLYGDDEYGDPTGVIGNTMYFSLYMERRLGPRYFLSTEALYNWAEDSHFIEIPLFLKWNAFHRLYIIGGPRLDIIISTYPENPKPFGFSAEVGAQYYLTKRLLIESRYGMGFSKHIHEFFTFPVGRRNNFRLGLGLQF